MEIECVGVSSEQKEEDGVWRFVEVDDEEEEE